jgi:hypothetical protein
MYSLTEKVMIGISAAIGAICIVVGVKRLINRVDELTHNGIDDMLYHNAIGE